MPASDNTQAESSLIFLRISKVVTYLVIINDAARAEHGRRWPAVIDNDFQ